LKELQGSKIFNNYFLVGGTALSLQLGHRVSDDIDLFTREELEIKLTLMATDTVCTAPKTGA